MMKGNLPSSSRTQNIGFQRDGVEKLKEPRLPGAYIRSLVKQLKSKGCPVDPKQRLKSERDGVSSTGDGFPDQKPETPRQSHKKQVRRRLHTARPYQEKLLNMAEARREIVTALKFHRERQRQPGPEIQPFQGPSSGSFTPDKFSSVCYPGSGFSYRPGFCCPVSWPVAPIVPSQAVGESFHFSLPGQTLGLNLNLEEFSNMDTASFHCNNNTSLSFSSSPPSNSDGFPGRAAPTESGLHPAMDDEEMTEIRTLGEQYEMELNDTLNLANSVWWFEFLKSMEMEAEARNSEDFTNYQFDEAMEEFPAWLSANERCWQYDYNQDPALPRMEIEEIGAMDADWLA